MEQGRGGRLDGDQGGARLEDGGGDVLVLECEDIGALDQGEDGGGVAGIPYGRVDDRLPP